MAPPPTNTARIEEAQKLSKTDPAKAETLYKNALSKGPGSGESALRDYEAALMGLGELYRDTKQPKKLAELVTTSRSTLSSFAKAKTAKLGMKAPLSLASIFADVYQSDNYLTSLPPSPIRPTSKYRPPNHA